MLRIRTLGMGCVVMLASAAMAQARNGARVDNIYNNGAVDIPLNFNSEVTTYTPCYTMDLYGFELYTDPNTFNFDYNMIGTVAGLQSTIPTLLRNGTPFAGVFPVPMPCERVDYVETIADWRGNTSLYTVAAGAFITSRTSKSSFEYADNLTILSPTATTLYLPVTLGGSAFASESFGASAETYGRIKVDIEGTVNGASVISNSTVLESVTILPEEVTFAPPEPIAIAVNSGATSVSVSLSADVEVKVAAKGGGFFGTVTGSATAGLNLTGLGVGGLYAAGLNSVAATGAVPLPPEVLIYSDIDLSIYANTLRADANYDGSVNVSDLGVLAASFRSTTTDGRSGGDFDLDGVVTVSDLGILASTFRIGLPSTSPLTFAEALAMFPHLPAVPEPAGALGSLMLLCVAGRRRNWAENGLSG